MDQKTYATQLAGKFESWRTAQGILTLLAFISSLGALSVAVFLRRNFGARYLGWVNLALTHVALFNFALFGNVIGSFFGRWSSQLIFLVWLAFIGASAFHRYVIWKQTRAGVKWHSYYPGTSLIPLPVSEDVKLLWIEPGLVMVVSILLSPFSALVSTWLHLSAISLWVHAHIRHYYQQQTVLDAVNAGLEARYLGEAVAGKPSSETAGVTIAESVRPLVRDDPEVMALMGGLPPELRDMMRRGD